MASIRRPEVATTGSLRPAQDGTATVDQNLRVLTNNFRSNFMATKSQKWHQYDVAFTPPELHDKRPMRARVIAEMQNKNAHIFSQARGSYDGFRNFYTLANLGQVFRAENVFNSQRSSVNVQLTHVGVVSIGALAPFLMRQANISDEGLNVLTFLSVALKMGPSNLQYIAAKNNTIYTPDHSQPIGNALEVCMAFYQSPRPGWGNLYINVDTTAGVMYKSGRLEDLILEYFGERNKNFLYNLSPERRREINRFFKGVDITAKHLPNRRPQTFSALDQRTPSQYLFDHQGQEISVKQYFADKYRMDMNPSLPLVDIGRKRMWPLDYVYVPGGQLAKKTVKLSPDQVTKVLGFATHRPEQRLQMIRDAMQQVLNYAGSDYLINSGLEVVQNTPPEPARRLPVPQLVAGQNQALPVSQGKWNMVRNSYFTPANLGAWFLLVLDGNEQRGRSFAQEMFQVFQAVGMNNPQPPLFTRRVINTQPPVVRQTLRQEVQAAKAHTGSSINLIICIVPPNTTALRTEIKRFGDIEAGIATQIIIGNKLKPGGNNQYCNNVALKINAKLGGINWVPHVSAVPALAQKASIIMGIDTSHPDPGSGSQPSMAAFVCSVDRPCSRYVGQCRIQSSRQEVVDSTSLTEMVMEGLKLYIQCQGMSAGPPQQVIVYRDGVAESQFREVIEHEVQAIRDGFTKLGVLPEKYKITFIAVGKLHHFRMFPTAKETSDGRTGNCPSGTIIDTGVTNPWWHDWYLLSQQGLLGTSRPAHYSILVNEENMSADDLQKVSYALCHIFTRSTRTVSIPAVVYYADLIAARLRFHIQNDNLFDVDRSSSGGSQHGAQETDPLLPWMNAFSPVHPNLRTRMYWM